MKFFGISIKREYVLYYLDPQSNHWFYDEPKDNKKDMSTRIEWLKHGHNH